MEGYLWNNSFKNPTTTPLPKSHFVWELFLTLPPKGLYRVQREQPYHITIQEVMKSLLANNATIQTPKIHTMRSEAMPRSVTWGSLEPGDEPAGVEEAWGGWEDLWRSVDALAALFWPPGNGTDQPWLVARGEVVVWLVATGPLSVGYPVA